MSKCPGPAAASGRSMASASSYRPALNKACAFAVSAAADRLAAGGDGGSLPALHAVAGRSRNAEAASTRRRGPITIACYFLNEPKGKKKRVAKLATPLSQVWAKRSGSHRRDPDLPFY